MGRRWASPGNLGSSEHKVSSFGGILIAASCITFCWSLGSPISFISEILWLMSRILKYRTSFSSSGTGIIWRWFTYACAGIWFRFSIWWHVLHIQHVVFISYITSYLNIDDFLSSDSLKYCVLSSRTTCIMYNSLWHTEQINNIPSIIFDLNTLAASSSDIFCSLPNTRICDACCLSVDLWLLDWSCVSAATFFQHVFRVSTHDWWFGQVFQSLVLFGHAVWVEICDWWIRLPAPSEHVVWVFTFVV